MKKTTITLCSSVQFYKHVVEIAHALREAGFIALIPDTAEKMAASGDFTPRKSWHTNEADFHIKKSLIDGHFKKIEKADAILVVNDEKNGISGYIGGNVLMEMTVAYYLKKKIYILNPVIKTLPIYEEVKGIFPTFLDGDLTKLVTLEK